MNVLRNMRNERLEKVFNDSLSPQEVIEILERGTTIPGDGYTFEQISEALRIAAREVGKMIAKRPIRKSWNPNRCPTCNADLGGECDDGYYDNPYYDRCPECGQDLDYDSWEET